MAMTKEEFKRQLSAYTREQGKESEWRTREKLSTRLLELFELQTRKDSINPEQYDSGMMLRVLDKPMFGSNASKSGDVIGKVSALPAVLREITDLQNIMVQGNTFDNGTLSVNRLYNLRQLSVDSPGLKHIVGLEDVGNTLTELRIGRNAFDDGTFSVQGLHILRKLNVSNAGLKQIVGLENVGDTLEELNISRNALDGGALSVNGLYKLRQLNAERAGLKRIIGLEDLGNTLQDMNVSRNTFDDGLLSVQGLHQLRSLNVKDAGLTRIVGLEDTQVPDAFKKAFGIEPTKPTPATGQQRDSGTGGSEKPKEPAAHQSRKVQSQRSTDYYYQIANEVEQLANRSEDKFADGKSYDAMAERIGEMLSDEAPGDIGDLKDKAIVNQAYVLGTKIPSNLLADGQRYDTVVQRIGEMSPGESKDRAIVYQAFALTKLPENLLTDGQRCAALTERIGTMQDEELKSQAIAYREFTLKKIEQTAVDPYSESLSSVSAHDSDSMHMHENRKNAPRYITTQKTPSVVEWRKSLPPTGQGALPQTVRDTSIHSSSDAEEHSIVSRSSTPSDVGTIGPSRYRDAQSDFTGDLEPQSEPTHATDARAGKLQKDSPVLKEWKKNLKTTVDGSLTLSQDGVDAFKKVALDSERLNDVLSVTIEGNEDQPYDLRSMTDLGERLGKFKNLQTLNLLNCKFDTLNISELPPLLRTINLTGSVVRLPLQEELQEHLKARFGEEGILLRAPRSQQIEKYKASTLEDWIQQGGSDPTARRDKAGQDTLKYLQSDPSPNSLNVSGYNVGEFDDDFYATIASNNLTALDLSRNKMKSMDFAKIALSPNLKNVLLHNNEISHVRNAESLGQLDSLQTLNMKNNQLVRVPPGIESASERSTINLQQNKLTPFAIIDARLIKFARGQRLKMLDSYLREQRGPTVLTDPISNDLGSLASRDYPPSVLDDLDENSARIQQLEKDLDNVGADASSLARLRDVGAIVEREAYVSALESVITSQGGPLKFGPMQRYHESAELAATVAGNRAITLHPVPGQPGVMSGTKPGLKDAKKATEAIGIGAKFIPVPWVGDVVGGVAKATGKGIDKASAHYFDAFHSKLAKVFSPPEIRMLMRVLPLAMTLTMGEQLESHTVHEGKDRSSEPSQTVIDFFKQAVGMKSDPSKAVEQRAFRDVAYLMADMASGAAYGVPDDEAALRQNLQGMTFEQKVKEPLAYWANGNNSANELLPFKERYLLCDSSLVKQLATVAEHSARRELEQGKQLKDLRQAGRDERRKRRAMTQHLIDKEIIPGPLSEWGSDSEKEGDLTRKLPASSAPKGSSTDFPVGAGSRLLPEETYSAPFIPRIGKERAKPGAGIGHG
jgi:Leucine-rich repeat (LRR) protein